MWFDCYYCVIGLMEAGHAKSFNEGQFTTLTEGKYSQTSNYNY